MAYTFTDQSQKCIDHLIADIDVIGLDVATSYTLADAIREGCGVTRKGEGTWGAGDMACTLSAAYLAARARGYVGQ